jgi:tryptophanyl-tRNA synthetase
MFCVVDLHAMTVRQDPKVLQRNTIETAAAFLAAGVDTSRSIIFPQSAVPLHAELAWIFQCVARVGWLDRMVQFREKTGQASNEEIDAAIERIATVLKNSTSDGLTPQSVIGMNGMDVAALVEAVQKTRSHREGASVGLYTYPVLQAADILLYKATHVPVGEDQMQHLNLCRDIAAKFNHEFEREVFPIPTALVSETGRIMSLKTGTTKMSKSDGEDGSRINLLDSDDQIAKKIRKATAQTEPMPETLEEVTSPAVRNLIAIYSGLADQPEGDVVRHYAGKGFGVFKPALADLAISVLGPVRQAMTNLMADPRHVVSVLENGADRALEIAHDTMEEIRPLVGMFS